MWIERLYEPTIRRFASQFPVVLVTGPRQVGKTSLLRHLYPDCTYVSFDHPALARQAEESPEEFFLSLKEPVILDEVQYVPKIFRHLKMRVDQDRRPGRFFLTGSQTFSLMQGVSESLAGRCGVLEMHSLSLSEIQGHDSKISEAHYFLHGGFPELYTRFFEKPQDWFGSYLSTYLERDVRNIKNVGDLRDFERLLRAVAARTSQILSYSEIARDVGITPNTAKQWISVLQISGQIYLLEPYYRNIGKRLVKSPKLYMLDVGLNCSLAGISTWEDLIQSPMAGALWETFVVMEVLRHFHAQGLKPPLWFWQTSVGDEVDLLIEKGKRFIAVECKFTEEPKAAHWKGLETFKKIYGEDHIEKSYLACRTKHPYLVPKADIKVIPGGLIGQQELLVQ